jgi:hypothetical protein
MADKKPAKGKARRVGTAKPARQGPRAPQERKPVLLNGREKAQKAFLESLSKYGIIAAACEDAFIARSTAYDWRSNDPGFASAWDEAIVTAVERAEKEAVRRAVYGVMEPVFNSDGLVGHRRKHSDTLLMFILKKNRPEYRDNTQHRHEHHGTTRVVRAADLTREELARIILEDQDGSD